MNRVQTPSKRVVGGSVLLLVSLFVSSGCLFLVLGFYEFKSVLLLELLLILGSAFLVFLLHWPAAGLAFLLIGGLMIAQTVGTGTDTRLNGAVLMVPALVGVWLIQTLLGKNKGLPLASDSTIPLLVFMSVVILSFFVGQYPWFPAPKAPITAQVGQLGIFLFSGFIFLASACYLGESDWLERVTWLFILLGVVHLATRLVPGIDQGALRGRLPLVVQSGSMFWTWLVAISFGQFLLNRDLNPLVRLAVGSVAGTALGIALIQSRDWLSGWFPALIAVGVIVLFRFPRSTLLGGPVIALLAGILGMDMLKEFVTGGDNVYSLETRGAAMTSLWPLLKANPLLGLGPANYHSYVVLYPILGYYIQYSSHNNYIDLIAQTGLIGLGCFAWFVWRVGRTAWNLSFRVTGGFERGYVHGVLGGLVATLIAGVLGDWFIPFVYNTGYEGFRTSALPWLFLGGVVAIESRRFRLTADDCARS